VVKDLVEDSESRCESEKEKQLLSAVKRTRKPYVESYLRAIHLLIDEGNHDAAEAAMVNETLGTIPVAAVCTVCNREFKVPVSSMKRVSDAQQLLKNEFAKHECKSEDASQ
jgi:hypothetical protein